MLLALAPVFAQGDALPMTRIERDPAVLGMAGASLSSSSSAAYSAFRSAAVLPFADMEMIAAGVGYQIWSPDLAKSQNLSASVAYRLSDRFGISAGVVSQKGEAYDVFKADGTPDGSYTPKDLVVAAGAGFAVTDGLSVGVNARYANQTLAEDVSYNGVSGDLWVLYRPLAELSLTAGVSTLGTQVTSASGKSYSQPASAVLAGSYRWDFATDHRIEPCFTADYYFSGNWGVSAGAEYAWKGLVHLRGGYRIASKEAVIPSHAAVGLGIHVKGVRVEAAWLTASKALGNTLTLGLVFVL